MYKTPKNCRKKKPKSKDYNFCDNTKIITVIFLIIIYIISNISFNKEEDKKFITNFNYTNYETFIITKDMEKKAGWMYMNSNQYYLINGIIRKHKPKMCLEVGVALGGSSILILNAIKDIKDSSLVSLDLNTNLYFNSRYKTGYRVKMYSPELTNKWQLYTGEQPHVFLEKLKLKYDFVFLDTAHITPGEIINLIEILPFLKENAIIILHDIVWHFSKEANSNKIISISSPTLVLMSSLRGDKIILKDKLNIENMGAIFLYQNQEKYYLDYFLLLLNFWEYMPSEKQIEELRVFIKKYYDKDLYLLIFESAIRNNKNYVNKLKKIIF